jgi:hypothetical protein
MSARHPDGLKRHMTRSLVIFLALFVLVALGSSARNSITSLRTGAFTNRDGVEINRLENPLLFWMGISLGLGLPIIVICFGLWTAAWLLIQGRG